MNENSLAVFEDYKIRRVYDEDSEIWYFSVGGYYSGVNPAA